MKAGTRHALLGLLLERPSYGYEVLLRFRAAFGVAQWAITPQGLYAALDRLERDGMIEPVERSGRDAQRRQPKTPYRVTRRGAQELRRFLETPMGADPSPGELLVRLQCVGVRDAGALSAMLDGYQRSCLEELGRLGGRPPASLAERLALEDRRLGIQARLRWIEYARGELSAVPGAPARPREESPAA